MKKKKSTQQPRIKDKIRGRLVIYVTPAKKKILERMAKKAGNKSVSYIVNELLPLSF